MKATKAWFLQAAAFAATLAIASTAGTTARAATLTFGLPAIPPIFVDVQAMVAAKQGFFKRYGVDVTLRNFPNGSEASRAVAAGDAALSLSPTPLVINQIANAGVNVVGIYGDEHPDYYLVSVDPKATCKSVAGQPVGVDAPGGALSVALKYMLAKCQVALSQVQQIGLSANVPTAMIAGQLNYAVLHLDGLMAVEAQTKKKLKIIMDFGSALPVYHNMLVIVRRDKLAANRDQYVRVIAGMIAAERYIRDPANRVTVAKIAAVTGRNETEALRALDEYVKMDFWPHDSAGLAKANIEAVAKVQEKAGNIRPGKTPPSYERVVDPSIFADAMALVKKTP